MNRFMKTALSTVILTTVMLVSSAYGQGTTSLEKCLDDQPNEIRECLGKTSKFISIESCYDKAKAIRSNHTKEKVRSYCFYHISEMPTLRSCLEKAYLFAETDNHDAAIFDCYSQFEKGINKATCEAISKKLSYPDKARYLKSHCQSLL
ncbi:hypothetical protein CIK05_03115 [Bdellovibrio sp. qaytius]|nr:hypothetical protein CIK05_03115 [Bdellovibrio sp. qaytius]